MVPKTRTAPQCLHPVPRRAEYRNLLPHPVTLFALLALGIVLLSGVFGAMGVAVVDLPGGAPGVAEDGMIRAVSLMN